MSFSVAKPSEQLADCITLKSEFSEFIQILDQNKLDSDPLNKACVFSIVIEQLVNMDNFIEAERLFNFADRTCVWDASKHNRISVFANRAFRFIKAN